MRLRSYLMLTAGILIPAAGAAGAPEAARNFTWEDPPPRTDSKLFLTEYGSYPDLPEFMKHWEYGIDIEDGRGPVYFADLILPIYRPDAEDRTFFFEPRVSHRNSETLMNFGLGYRQLVFDRSWLLGGNLFLDHETQVHHTRVGVGTEAVSAYAEFRANGYFGVSRARVTDRGPGQNTVEKAVDGYDLELGFPVPRYSRLKFFGKYEWYDFKQFDDRDGWQVRAEYRPIPFLVLDVRLRDTNKQDTAWGFRMALRPPFWENHPKHARSPFSLDQAIFPDSDVSGRLYIPVERRHEIVVERYGENNGSVTVEITRNN